MKKKNNLISGIGGHKETKIYYDNWSKDYDENLKNWNYDAPKKSIKKLRKYKYINPKKILDLACGTGLFGGELRKLYPNSKIDGMDISKKILIQAKKKNIYNKLINGNFDNKIRIKKRYNLISCIGAMTYTKDPEKLFSNIFNITESLGYFIFTHRIDLFEKENYTNILKKFSQMWSVISISRPMLYLPKNKDFSDKIKIKIILLHKNKKK